MRFNLIWVQSKCCCCCFLHTDSVVTRIGTSGSNVRHVSSCWLFLFWLELITMTAESTIFLMRIAHDQAKIIFSSLIRFSLSVFFFFSCLWTLNRIRSQVSKWHYLFAYKLVWFDMMRLCCCCFWSYCSYCIISFNQLTWMVHITLLVNILAGSSGLPEYWSRDLHERMVAMCMAI